MSEEELEDVSYIPEKDVTVVLKYVFSFEAARTCGSITVYYGKSYDDEAYEIYKEVLDCKMDRKRVEEAFKRVVDEIKKGEIEV